MNLLPLAALLLLGRMRRGGASPWPSLPAGGELPIQRLAPQTPPPAPAATPPSPVAAPPAPVDEVRPPARTAVVQQGEGPYPFVARVVGRQYAAGWRHLADANPDLRFNKARDNFTNASWRPGMVVVIPADWPGGTTQVSGDDDSESV